MANPSSHALSEENGAARSDDRDTKNYTATMMIKIVAGLITTVPFLQPTVEIIKENPISGAFLVASIPCIFAIGYEFYGQHVIELFNPRNAVDHIGEDLGLSDEDIHKKKLWELRTKLVIFLAVSAATFPLGLTKVDLDNNASPLYFYLKLICLAAYSAMEACPHVNHWQFWREALKKFLSLAWQYKIWVCILVLGHGLNDVADLWNAEGFWFLWTLVGISTEFFLPLIESVAHSSLKFPEKITLTTIAQLFGIFYGAYGIAVFNWYNTFNDLDFFVNDSSRITFFILQNISAFFLVFVVQDHILGGHDHDHDSNAAGDIELHSRCGDCRHGSSDDPNVLFCLEAGTSVGTCGLYPQRLSDQNNPLSHVVSVHLESM